MTPVLSNNSYEMILQYCLSVYAVNFFTPPDFTTFKLRIINQQNGDCKDSSLLDTRTITSATFPVHIKLKGSDRLLIKVKLISLLNKSTEIAQGEGVVSFDLNSIDGTMRVPIYDKKKGVEQVAICSVDLLITGHQLSKNISGVMDKSKSKIQDWRDHSEDIAYSQMSYTVQSENEQKNVEQQQKKHFLEAKTNDYKHKTLQNTFKRTHEPKISANQSQKMPAIQIQEEQRLPLQNSAYLSEPSERKVVSPNKQKSNAQSRKREPSSSSSESSLPSKQQVDNLARGVSPDKLKQKLQKSQNLLQKLKKYLQMYQKQEAKPIFHLPKHKIRRQAIKVEQIAYDKPTNTFLKYYQESKDKNAWLLKNFRVIKTFSEESKNYPSQKSAQVLINKITLTSENQQKIVTFDYLRYRAHCMDNEIRQAVVDLKIPKNQSIVKAIIFIKNNEAFQGVVSIQEGKQIMIKLSPRQSSKNIYNAILNREQYRLCFDLQQQNFQQKQTLQPNKRDVSFKQAEEEAQGEDIKHRIRSFSMQPWSYGHSYLKQLQSVQSSIKKHNVKSLFMEKTKKSNSLPKKSIKNQPIFNGLSSPSKRLSKKQQFPLKKRQIGTKSFYTSQNSQVDIQPSKSVSLESSSVQEEVKSLSFRSKGKKQQVFLNNLRNGNRNNFKIKEKKSNLEQNGNKTSNVKEMWEKLLIKKKIEEDQIQQIKIKIQNKQLNSAQSLKKQSRKREEINTKPLKQQKSQLYGCIAGTKEVHKVNQNWHKQVISDYQKFPLRTVTLQIKNISITQPQVVVDEDVDKPLGKFIKFEIKGKISYFTEIIFNGQFNSILWKLSGCFFRQLTGNERLQVQIYKTLENKIDLIGKTSIKVSRLYFLRNNHIYNGKISYDNILHGQFTLGFEIQEFYPFQVIQEEQQQEIIMSKRQIPSEKNIRQTQPAKTREMQQHPRYQSIQRKKRKYRTREGANKLDLQLTLKRQSKPKNQSQLLQGESKYIEALSDEEQESQILSEGFQHFQ